MPANYDNAAWFYDRLSQLAYGKQLINAQVFLLNYIPADSKIFIIGGGTGTILDEITKIHPSGLTITYIELSAKMVQLSKKRNIGKNTVKFIVGSAEQIMAGELCDVMITPFLFDNFTEQDFQLLFSHLKHQLKPNGLWLNADFQLTGKWWQLLLLKTMYSFFHLLGCVEVNHLPNIDATFSKYQYKALAQKTFFGEFVKSTVYQQA